MKVALIQQKASRDLDDNLERGIAAFHMAVEAGADVVAYAELAFLPFLPQVPAGPDAADFAQTIPGPITERFSKLAAEAAVVVVLNLFEKDGQRTYDASPVIDADGTLLGITRMVHVMDGLGFYEKGYYSPGNRESFVYDTLKGRIGVAICYDRHFPEYMRALALQGAELVIVPQAGAVGEWTEGIYEAELQVAAFQNGYYTALVNRVGREEFLHFSGESFVADPDGRVIARAPREEDFVLVADCDPAKIASSAAAKFFLKDRRPGFYRAFGLYKDKDTE